MKPGMMYKSLIVIMIIIAGVALVSYILPAANKPAEIPLSQAIAMSRDNGIEKIMVEGDALLITAVDGTEYRTFKESNANIYDIEGLNLEGVVVEIEGSSGFNWGGALY